MAGCVHSAGRSSRGIRAFDVIKRVPKAMCIVHGGTLTLTRERISMGILRGSREQQRGRPKEREGKRERGREGERGRDIGREGKRERKRGRERGREKEREGERERKGER